MKKTRSVIIDIITLVISCAWKWKITRKWRTVRCWRVLQFLLSRFLMVILYFIWGNKFNYFNKFCAGAAATIKFLDFINGTTASTNLNIQLLSSTTQATTTTNSLLSQTSMNNQFISLAMDVIIGRCLIKLLI